MSRYEHHAIAGANPIDIVEKCVLDAAVFLAYGWEDQPGDGLILERLLELNLERSSRG